MLEFGVHMPRHAFSLRDCARAGDVWRAFQEVAIDASTAIGWPPERYRREGSAFVVRSMIVNHEREPRYGESLRARTWTPRFRRDIFLTRQIRMACGDEPIAACTQEWAHVSSAIEAARAPESITSAFNQSAGPDADAPPTMPECVKTIAAPTHRYSIRAWWTWMDPLDHLNHPAYVDYIDETISVAMHEHGIAPLRLVPVAEQLTFRSGVVGGEIATVETTPRGWTAEGAAIFEHQIKVGERLCVTGTTVRRVLDEAGESSLIGAITASSGTGAGAQSASE